MRVLGQEDPLLKVGEVNERDTKSHSGIVYSLKDLNLNVQQGEAIGIIGKNGAGKSTLLKIISRVTSPTTGRIKIRGRIASLLEVGTGFHPELTGRENVFLNGAILGMRKKEIKHKFDEIVDFSGVERYIDTPVKRYSSGMYVRLAFAVAAHLESEILIIDEVLAVGDSEFQKKCLGKMGEVTQAHGRTILFVSHQMQAIEALCPRVMLLNNGVVQYDGSTQEGLKKYAESYRLNCNMTSSLINASRSGGNQKAIKEAWIENSEGKLIKECFMGDSFTIYCKFEADHELIDPGFGFSIDTYFGLRLSTYGNYIEEINSIEPLKSGIVSFKVNKNIFLPGLYLVNFGISERRVESIDYIKGALELEILPSNVYGTGRVYESSHGPVRMDVTFTINNLKKD